MIFFFLKVQQGYLLGLGCPTFFSRGPDLLLQNFRGPKFTLWDSSSSKKRFFAQNKVKTKKKKKKEKTNSVGFTNKMNIKDSHL